MFSNHHIIFFILITVLPRGFGNSNCVHKPHFKSNWVTMKAQTTDRFINLEHECGVLPVFVDVQVRPLTNLTNYYFPGLASSQRDDDMNITYGGVVYKYNNDSLRLYVPKKNDGFPAGTVIFTGDSNWRGPVQQKENEAEVRARVWCPADFPAPTFESRWEPINNTRSGSFIEMSHHMNRIPDLITVQIKLGKSDWTIDGVGSMTAVFPSLNTSWGGVIFGYNDKTVRIWAPYQKNGHLFSVDDGWGTSTETASFGYVKVRGWLVNGVERTSMTLNQSSKTQISLSSGLNRDEDLIYVRVKADTGDNIGYSFPASGVVQNIDVSSSYGGVVYSYSDKEIHIWTPRLTGHTFLIYVNNQWGNSKYSQNSTTAILTAYTWKVAGTCEHTSTTKPSHGLQTYDVGHSKLMSNIQTTKKQSQGEWKSSNPHDSSSGKAFVLPVAVSCTFIGLVTICLIIAFVLYRKHKQARIMPIRVEFLKEY